MNVDNQINAYLARQPEAKRSDLEALHRILLGLFPNGPVRFLDGRDASGKVVSNPNVGYGTRMIRYANGTTREFYQVGLSANTAGISVYIMGIEDKTHLAKAYGRDLGKATVTGYCIRFKALADIRLPTLEAAVRDGIRQTGPNREP